MLKFRVNPLWCCYDGIGGSGIGSGGIGGQSGEGSPGHGGHGGQFGGNSEGSVPDFASDFSGEPDTNIAGAVALGTALGNAMAHGSMTASEANAAMASQGFGLAATIAGNMAGLMSGTPASVSALAGKTGMPVATGMALAALGAALTGQGAFGAGSGDGIGDQAGPGLESLMEQGQQYLTENNMTTEDLMGIAQEGGIMTDNEKLIRDKYKTLFKRDNPDQTGIDYWLSVLNDPESGVTADNLEAKMTEAAGDWDLNDAGSIWTNKNTGDNVYNDARDSVTSGDVDSDLGADDSQTNEERLIRGFYQDLFGRDNPDAEGLKFWTDMLNNGVSADDVRAKMEQAGGAWTPQGDGNWLRDDGLSAEDDMPTDYQYDIDNPQIFKDYVNSFYDSALQEYQNQSEQYQKATDEYKDTSSRLLGDQQDMLAGLTGRLDGSVTDYRDETGGYLDRLLGAIDDTKSSNRPRVNRLAGGQEVSYIPGSLRAANNDDRTAELALFDRSKGVSDNLLSTQTGNAGTIWDAGNTTVNTGLNEGRQVYGNDMVMANQGNATLNYLDALRQLVGDERALDDSTARRIAAEQGNQFNYDRLASQEEMAEPGMLDYIKGIGTTANTVKDIFSLFG